MNELQYSYILSVFREVSTVFELDVNEPSSKFLFAFKPISKKTLKYEKSFDISCSCIFSFCSFVFLCTRPKAGLDTA
ncbi:MAG: hypothetical protein EAZ57_00495 [Cytophagales bacterium]|nr:MAG: hypothetical protein EAZ67_00635 [Cytophagales bacterium]TAF62269.1 MAG: hypothetical protein EAZ57_00495 [Cytophagales bacterium]